MAALAAGRTTPPVIVPDSEQGGHVMTFSQAASDIIFKGSFVELDAGGDLRPGSTGTAARVVGIALETVDNASGSDGDTSVRVLVGATIEHALTATVADIGKSVYCTDDQTLTLTQAAGNSYVGIITQLLGTNLVAVKMSEELAVRQDYTTTNFVASRTFDSNGSILVTNDVLGTLLQDLADRGIIAGTSTA